MWDCIKCGCKAIIADLPFCPMCREEKDMPKTTSGGSSNAWVPAEVAPEPTPEPEAAPEPEVVPEPAPEPAAEEAPQEITGSGGLELASPGAVDG